MEPHNGVLKVGDKVTVHYDGRHINATVTSMASSTHARVNRIGHYSPGWNIKRKPSGQWGGNCEDGSTTLNKILSWKKYLGELDGR